VGKHGDALKIKLITTTVGGIANDTLINFLAQKLEIEREKIEIAAGLASAEKMVVVVGLTPTEVENRLLG
jgi:hypothetical protein